MRPSHPASRFTLAVVVSVALAITVHACGFEDVDGVAPSVRPARRYVSASANAERGDVATDAQLFDQVQLARTEYGLEPIARSPALDAVARQHVEDLENNYPVLPCNLHSWSTDGPWTACCYTAADPIPECMVNKPAELTDYPGLGFEIAVSVIGSKPVTAEQAVDLWLASPSHRAVLLNEGTWADDTWRAVGVAITEHYAVVWFGRHPDES